jgi:uncharacterized membrane protein YgcG
MGFDDRCFTAAIVNLGVKRHLKIVDDGTETTLHKTGEGQAAAPEEKTMEARLFGARRSLQLKQENHVTLGGAKEALKDSLEKTYVGTLFTKNYLWSGLGLLLVLIVAAGVVAAAAASHNYELLAMLAILLFATMPFVMFGASMMFVGWHRSVGGSLPLIGGLVILALAVAAGVFVIWYNVPGAANLATLGAVYIAGAAAGIGFPWLKAPSRAGRKAMDDIEGFRQYLGVAEEDRLNALNPPEKTPELFERFLPYAIALDVQNAWAQRFAGVLAAAGAAAATSAWYQGSHDWRNDPVSFADHFGSSLSQTISSASTAPGSGSGSGGGGSSGGGGGGGGGSGW